MVDVRPYWYNSNGPVNWRGSGKRRATTPSSEDSTSATSASEDSGKSFSIASNRPATPTPSTHLNQATTPTSTSRSRLASVQQQQQGQAIGIGDILNDVTNTMDALGADTTTRQTVSLYLGAIAHQATEATPSKPFIREALKSVGNVLDGFITATLHQSSRVVRDWVEALLLQPVQFHDPQLDIHHITQSALQNPTVPENSAESPPPNPPSQPPLPAWKTIRGWIEHHEWDKAQPALEAWMNQAATPTQTTRGLLGLIALNEAQQQHHALKTLYPQALQSGQEAYQNLTAKKSQQTLAKVLAETANDYGCWLHRQPEATAKEAVEAWKTARHWAIIGDKAQLPDIYANLAVGYHENQQLDKARQALNQGIRVALRLGDAEAEQSLWQKLQDFGPA
ncbi:MAG: hypothetical protein U0003_02825 [Vampirovibrionales bacterium]